MHLRLMTWVLSLPRWPVFAAPAPWCAVLIRRLRTSLACLCVWMGRW